MRRFGTFFGVFVVCVGLAFGVSAVDASEAEAQYSQIVDNATQGRFLAPGWGGSAYSPMRYGANYRFAAPKAGAEAWPARYKVRIPQTASYTVFARYPSDPGYNPRTLYGVRTLSGWKWRAVSQQKFGGRWIRLGVYNMRAGDNYSVQVSRATPGRGHVIADAIQVVRGNVAAPPAPAPQASGGAGQVTGLQVANQARTWLGVPYRFGGTTRQGVDCSGFTFALYRTLGINIPRVAANQFHEGPGFKVATTNRQRGFLIFGNTGNQSGIQHVGVLMGNGRMIHAPFPGTVVREEDIGSWYNVIGVKRIVPAA